MRRNPVHRQPCSAAAALPVVDPGQGWTRCTPRSEHRRRSWSNTVRTPSALPLAAHDVRFRAAGARRRRRPTLRSNRAAIRSWHGTARSRRPRGAGRSDPHQQRPRGPSPKLRTTRSGSENSGRKSAEKLGHRLQAVSCGRHISRPCPKTAAEGCYSCPDFQTDSTFLPIHSDTLHVPATCKSKPRPPAAACAYRPGGGPLPGRRRTHLRAKPREPNPVVGLAASGSVLSDRWPARATVTSISRYGCPPGRSDRRPPPRTTACRWVPGPGPPAAPPGSAPVPRSPSRPD